MAKTIDLAKLADITKNSASLLGKNTSGTLGYVPDTFNDKGELSDVQEKFDKDSTKPMSGKAVAEAIKNFATKDEVNGKVTKELTGTASGDVAKIQNQNDGGVMQYVKSDGSNSAITVNDGSQKVGAEICSIDSKKQGSRIVVNTEGAYYSVGTTVETDEAKEIAVKGDLESKADKTELANYVAVHNDKNDTKSYIANEADGGIMKYIKGDESYSKVTLCDVDNQAAAQIVATDKDKKQLAKLDVRKGVAYYAKKAGNPDAKDEIVVKKDLEAYSLTEIKSTKGTALLFNEADGGGAVFDGTDTKSGVAVNDGTNNIYAQLYAINKSDKQGVRLNVTKEKIYYTKSNSSTSTDNDELVTKKDLEDLKKDLEAKVAKITELEKQVSQLQASNEAAINQVNEYTANVKQLLKQS